ncbi:MAG: type I-B CRISPR-associated protein Cas5b [Candidatus Heimdallarchaeaceae archaeon]
MDDIIVFEVEGQFAHFRAFDTTRENISYPFPPRTSVIGMIAGIMGYPRNSYWSDSPLASAKISIQILNPIWRSKIRVNYLQTRSPISFKSKLKIILPQDPFEIKMKDQRGFYAPVNLNILRNVAYRIFFTCDSAEIMDEFYERLKEHRYCFSPYLGHANMLAEVKLVGRFKAKTLSEGIYEIDSVLPTSALDVSQISLEDLGYSILFNVPISLGYEKEKLYLKKTEHLIFNSSSKKKLRAACKPDTIYQLNIDGKNLNIAFISE